MGPNASCQNRRLIPCLVVVKPLAATPEPPRIRSVPANSYDSTYCSVLGQMAVHGAMAGYSGITEPRMRMVRPYPGGISFRVNTFDLNPKSHYTLYFFYTICR